MSSFLFSCSVFIPKPLTLPVDTAGEVKSHVGAWHSSGWRYQLWWRVLCFWTNSLPRVQLYKSGLYWLFYMGLSNVFRWGSVFVEFLVSSSILTAFFFPKCLISKGGSAGHQSDEGWYLHSAHPPGALTYWCSHTVASLRVKNAAFKVQLKPDAGCWFDTQSGNYSVLAALTTPHGPTHCPPHQQPPTTSVPIPAFPGHSVSTKTAPIWEEMADTVTSTSFFHSDRPVSFAADWLPQTYLPPQLTSGYHICVMKMNPNRLNFKI